LKGVFLIEKRILQDGGVLFIGKLGTAIAGILSFVILSRVLSTEDMGRYSLFLMVANMAVVLALSWSDSSIVRHGRQEFVKSRKIRRSFWARIAIFIPIVVIATAAILAFSRPIAGYIGITEGSIYLVITFFLLNGMLNFLNYIYQSIGQMKKSALVFLIQKISYLLLLVLLLLGLLGSDITAVLFLVNASFLLTLLLNIASFDFRLILPVGFDKGYMRKIWSYSWPQFIGFPGLYVINYIDLFFIKYYLTLSDVGIYSIAYSIFVTLSSFLLLVNTVFFPLIVEYRTKKEYGKIRRYIMRVPLLVLGWGVIASIGIIISSWALPLVFSQKYSASVPSFQLLLFGSIFYFTSICLLPIINAFDLIIYSQIFNLAKAAINIAGDFLLVPKMGILGAALGTTIAYCIALGLSIMLLYAKRKLFMRDLR
jgi:O-antigen/teichoic acid export membrane protein